MHKLLNIDNPYFAQMVSQIYPTDLQFDKANPSDTEAPFTNGIDSTKIYDKRDAFYFEIFNFPFLGGVFLAPLPMMYTFRNLFVLQEYVLILMTSTKETNLLKQVIDTINSVKLFLNVITETQN